MRLKRKAMKSKILIFVLGTVAFSTPAFASWSVLYDNGGGSGWVSSIGSFNYLINNTGMSPAWQDAVGNSGQAALDASYALDPSNLPTLTGPNAFDAGLTWHCGTWSQFSLACTGGGGTPPPLLDVSLALNNFFYTASSTCEQTNATGTATWACNATTTTPIIPYGDWLFVNGVIIFLLAFSVIANIASVLKFK